MRYFYCAPQPFLTFQLFSLFPLPTPLGLTHSHTHATSHPQPVGKKKKMLRAPALKRRSICPHADICSRASSRLRSVIAGLALRPLRKHVDCALCQLRKHVDTITSLVKTRVFGCDYLPCIALNSPLCSCCLALFANLSFPCLLCAFLCALFLSLFFMFFICLLCFLLVFLSLHYSWAMNSDGVVTEFKYLKDFAGSIGAGSCLSS